LEAENASLKTENAILKDDLRQLRQEIEKLKEKPSSGSLALSLDETMERILIALAQGDEGVEKNNLAKTLRLKIPRLEYYLHILEEHHYIYGIYVPIGGAPITYHLTQKGREFLIEKDLI
jgi:hypothetical protein